jgi:NAD(P) transhydrogenase subunit alpha
VFFNSSDAVSRQSLPVLDTLAQRFGKKLVIVAISDEPVSVVWTVTPALHTPLMAVTNAISAIVIVGAMLAAALTETTLGKTMGVLAVTLAAVNVFGGFLVTRRMLEMFKKKEKKAISTEGDKA